MENFNDRMSGSQESSQALGENIVPKDFIPLLKHVKDEDKPYAIKLINGEVEGNPYILFENFPQSNAHDTLSAFCGLKGVDAKEALKAFNVISRFHLKNKIFKKLCLMNDISKEEALNILELLKSKLNTTQQQNAFSNYINLYNGYDPSIKDAILGLDKLDNVRANTFGQIYKIKGIGIEDLSFISSQVFELSKDSNYLFGIYCSIEGITVDDVKKYIEEIKSLNLEGKDENLYILVFFIEEDYISKENAAYYISKIIEINISPFMGIADMFRTITQEKGWQSMEDAYKILDLYSKQEEELGYDINSYFLTNHKPGSKLSFLEFKKVLEDESYMNT